MKQYTNIAHWNWETSECHVYIDPSPTLLMYQMSGLKKKWLLFELSFFKTFSFTATVLFLVIQLTRQNVLGTVVDRDCL